MKKIFFILGIAAISCNKNASEDVVLSAPEKPLSGEFKMSLDDVSENQEVTLTPLDTRSGNTYYWDFGVINTKKVTSDKTIPIINFKMHGYYTITLTVTDKKGSKALSTQYLPVTCSILGSGSHTSSLPEIK